MGAPGPPAGFDIQNFFIPSAPGFDPPSTVFPSSSHPFHPSSHPFPPNNYNPANSYPSPTIAFPSLPGSYAFPSQGTIHHPYMHYPQDHGPRPYSSPPYTQPNFSQPVPSPSPVMPHSTVPLSSLSQLNLRSPISSPPMDGARLMALLNSHSSGDLTMKDESMASLLTSSTSLELPPPALNSAESFQGSSQVSNPPAALAPVVPSAPPVSLAPPSASRGLLSSKLPRGRHLKGEHIVYDIDVRLPGEAQPQLEVSPITVYGSDPVLVVGRQIAVNRNYICYGLRAGTIRILNINTALRALLRGHSQRVTDMAFFAEDVHLLASASSDGRVFVRRITEGLGEDGKMQITEQILLAIQIFGNWESAHPRVCWNSHVQDLLVVGVGKYVLTIDIPRVRMAAAPGGFTAEDLLKCYVDTPIEGMHCVLGHDADVTDLSTSERTRLASASKDGMVRIWGDKKMLPISSFKPHDGHPVGSVAFLSAPHRNEHIVLLTAGQFNRELKLWVSAGGEGWFPQSGNVKWQCIQTLELKSSTEENVEDAFFNQVLVVPRACLVLLANAKKNAIYVVHIEFGLNPSATRMDYLAEFSVTIPILSLTATSENVFDGEGVVQVYCVQTQAIQQYSLDLLQCLPPSSQEPLVTSTLSFEKDLISSSQVFERSISATLPAIETTLVGGRAKSPEIGRRAKSPGPVCGVSKSTLFTNTMNTFEVQTSREQMPTVSIEQASLPETKSAMVFGSKEVKEIFTVENSSSLPKIVAPTPQVGLVVVSPTGSPLARGSGSPALTVSAEVADKLLQVHEQSLERKVEDASKSDCVPLSPRSIYDESLKKDGGRESPISRTSSVIAEQQADSNPVHLITPSDIMSMVARSKAEADGGLATSPRVSIVSKDISRGECKTEEGNIEIERSKMETNDVAESSVPLHEDKGAEKEAILEGSGIASEIKEKGQTGASSDSEPLRENNSMQSLLPEQAGGGEIEQVEEGDVSEEKDLLVNVQVDEVREQLKEVTVKISDDASVVAASESPSVMKGRKNKNKTNAAATMSPSLQAPSTSTTNVISDGDLSIGSNAGVISSSNLAAHILAMQDSLNQLVAMHKELQKQIPVTVAVPVTKEGKRMEAALGQRMEKVLKAHVDAMWARIQEENAKREKLERDRVQQLTTLLSSSLNKDLPAALERALKKEVSSIGPAIARLVNPNIEKAIPTAVNEAFQKGINEKGIMQLEKSVGAKLEAAVSRQLQSQFQTTGRQALQEALRSCFESFVIPAFDRSCKAIFEQVDAAFQRGMAEHTTYAQQHFVASHSALTSTLQDTVASASSLAASLKGVADEQSKLFAKSAGSARLFSNKQSNGSLSDKVVTVRTVELSLDPTIELSRLVVERKLEEAFNKALSLSDVAVVSWLCTQVDPGVVFTTSPLPLSQGVLLSLVQQLGCDLGNDTARKLTWIREAALALNPNDPVLAPHMRRILEQLYQNLNHQMLLPNITGELTNSIRLVMHVTNSLRTSCK